MDKSLNRDSARINGKIGAWCFHWAHIAGVYLAALIAPLGAQVPQLLNYQGRVQVGTSDFNGTGQFKFALVSANGSATYWSNDGTSNGGSPPTTGVTLPVTHGLYAVALGSSALPGMQSLPPTVFTNADVHLRVWFNDGTNGFQQFVPDQRIAAVGYAMMAATAQTAAAVNVGAITSAMLADGAVTAGKLATGAVTAPALAAGAVTSNAIAAGAVGATQLARKYAAGRLDSTNVTGAMFGSAVDLNGQFGFSFTDRPILDYRFETRGETNAAPGTLDFINKSTTGFTLQLSNLAPQSVLIRPGDLGLDLSSRQQHLPTTPSFQQPFLTMVGGLPAISCWEATSNNLVYFVALDASGSSWSPGVVVTPNGAGGSASSMTVWNGRPAIAFRDVVTKQLKFTRAANSRATQWTTPLVIATDAGERISLAVVDGLPAVVYVTESFGELRYLRAANSSATSWDAPLALFGSRVGYAKLIEAKGFPAVAFHSLSSLYYMRALNEKGGSWPTPTVLAAGTPGQYACGEFASLQVIEGYPAIAFYADAKTHTNKLAVSEVRYRTAADAEGSAWSSPVVVDRGKVYTCRRQTNTGTPIGQVFPEYETEYKRAAIDVGRGISLRSINSEYGQVPAILFRGCDSEIDPSSVSQNLGGITIPNGLDAGDCRVNYIVTYQLSFVRAKDAKGLVWESPNFVSPPRRIATLFGSQEMEAPIYDSSSAMLIDTGIRPAFCFPGDSGLVYVNQQGNSGWQDPFTGFSIPLPSLASGPVRASGRISQVILTNGLPWVAYYDPSRSVLRHVPALDRTGASWKPANTFNEVVDGGNNVGYGTSLAIGNGGIAVAYHDATAKDLKYTYFDGRGWSEPVRADASGDVGAMPSLILLNGKPAVAYQGAGASAGIRFIRAGSLAGEYWEPHVIVATGSVRNATLQLVNGRPAITFLRFVGGSDSLRFVRAQDALGSTWGSEVTVATNVNSLEYGFRIANGQPALAFQQDYQLRYTRALDADGTAWPIPRLLDASALPSGERASLAVIGGNPAIAYVASPTNMYVRALDADGNAWASPTIIDPSNYSTLALKLIEVGGKPGIGFRRDPITHPQFQVATSEQGTNWNPAVLMETEGTAGAYLSLASDGNLIAAAYYEPSEGALRVSRSVDQGYFWHGPDVPDEGGTGSSLSAALVGGLPAIAYRDDVLGGLKFQRSGWLNGVPTWYAPGNARTLDTNVLAGLHPSMIVLSNNLPAVAYYDHGTGKLKFVRATDSLGNAWALPIVVDTGIDVGRHPSLALVGGNPAIAYYDAINTALKFVSATGVAGTSWNVPITVDAGTNGTDVGSYTSLAVVNGKPAIAYADAAGGSGALYVRANDTAGTSWSNPIRLSNPGAKHIVLRVINNHPVVVSSGVAGGRVQIINGSISYQPGGTTRIEVAADPNGDSWSPGVDFAPAASGVAVDSVNDTPLVSLLTSGGAWSFYPFSKFQVNWFAVEP